MLFFVFIIGRLEKITIVKVKYPYVNMFVQVSIFNSITSFSYGPDSRNVSTFKQTVTL